MLSAKWIAKHHPVKNTFVSREEIHKMLNERIFIEAILGQSPIAPFSEHGTLFLLDNIRKGCGDSARQKDRRTDTSDENTVCTKG